MKNIYLFVMLAKEMTCKVERRNAREHNLTGRKMITDY